VGIPDADTRSQDPVSSTDDMPSLEIPDAVLGAVPEFGAQEEAVVIVDFQGVVLGINEPAEKLFGLNSDDIAGEFVEMLVPTAKRWGHQAYRRGYLAEPRDREMDPGLYPEAETAEGEIVPIVGRLQPVRVDGALFVAAHLARDDAPRPESD
jgi:PAS domain S-box-containing protein